MRRWIADLHPLQLLVACSLLLAVAAATLAVSIQRHRDLDRSVAKLAPGLPQGAEALMQFDHAVASAHRRRDLPLYAVAAGLCLASAAFAWSWAGSRKRVTGMDRP